jgi:hypothetical protein
VEITLNVISPNAEGNVDTAFYEMQPNRTESMIVYLKNTGTGTLTFTAGMGVGTNILSGISPNSGSVLENDSMEITVTMRSNGKSPGVYNDMIWFSTNDPINTVEEIQVETLVDINVGVHEITKDIISYFKNGNLNIISESNFDNIKSIDIIDANGKLVHSWPSITRNTLSINLESKGTYFIKFNTKNRSASKSVIYK